MDRPFSYSHNGSALVSSRFASGWTLSRFPSASAWSAGCCAPLRSALLQSKLPRSRLLSAGIVTLRLFATRGFLPPRTKPIRASGPPWGFALAPVHPRCSRRLSAGTQTPGCTGTPRPRPPRPAPPAAGIPRRPAASARTSCGSRSRRSSRWP